MKKIRDTLFIFLMLITVAVCSKDANSEPKSSLGFFKPYSFNFKTYSCRDLKDGFKSDVENETTEIISIYLYYAGEIGQESISLDENKLYKVAYKLGQLCRPEEANDSLILDIVRENKIGLPLAEAG